MGSGDSPAPGLAEVADAIRARGRRIEFTAGQVLFHEGEPGSSLFLVLAGRVRFQRSGPDGDALRLGEVGAGGFVGEMAILDPAPRSATAIAVEDGACLRLSSADLQELLWDDPNAARALLAMLTGVLAERVRSTDAAIADLAAEADRLGASTRGAEDVWRLLFAGEEST